MKLLAIKKALEKLRWWSWAEECNLITAVAGERGNNLILGK